MKKALKAAYLGLRAAALRPFYPRAPRPELDSIRSILVLRFDRIGDMVLATPLLAALREEFPAARLEVLASPANAAVLEGNPAVDEVHRLPAGEGRRECLARLRERRFDLLVDPYWEYELAWARVAGAVGARYRLGWDIAGRGLYYNLRVPAPLPPLPASELMLELCRRGLGRPFRFRPPKLYVSEEEARSGRERLPPGPVILLHPGGHYPEQRWAPERFAETAAALLESGLWRVAAVGGPADEPLLARLAAGLPGLTIVRTGSLRELIAALSAARLVICNNSGPLHIACALGVPTLSTLGPTDAALWSPPGPPHVVIAANPLDRLGVKTVVAGALAMLEP